MRRYPQSEITTYAQSLFDRNVSAHSLHNTIKILHKAGKIARVEKVRRAKVEGKPKRRKRVVKKFKDADGYDLNKLVSKHTALMKKKQKRVIQMP